MSYPDLAGPPPSPISTDEINSDIGDRRALLQVDREAERAAWSERVAVAIKHGAIAREVERRHFEDYAEQLEANGGDAAEVEAVGRLLSMS
jgi:hypothetical protein